MMSSIEPDMTILSPLQRASLGAEVARILRRYVVDAGLNPGDKLPSERDLSRRLGVSHRVVREALAELVEEGLIRKEHGRGAFVQSVGRSREVDRHAGGDMPADLLEARAVLECGVMPLVVERASGEDLDKLEAILKSERERYAMGESPAAEDIEFHMTLLSLAGNATLAQFGGVISASLRENIYRTPTLLATTSEPDRFAMDTHAEILSALRAGDSMRAITAAAAHLGRPIPR